MHRFWLILPLCLALTGCLLQPGGTSVPSSGAAISGVVHGGQQPVVGAHVYLFAANTTGYGGSGIAASPANASVSLLKASATGYSDALGGYVLTDASGSFSITGDYACTTNSQVYAYALGGNPGAGTNSAAGFLAILGTCPGASFASTNYVWINEVTTIAAAYSFAGFATDATHVSSSGTPLAQTGIANACANWTNFVLPNTGVARAPLVAEPVGSISRTSVNTLANILAACVNSTGPGSGPCTTLFNNAKSGGSTGSTASDTATAAINIAHNPGANVAALYAIPTPAQAFSPALTSQPNDFTLALRYTGNSPFSPRNLAIDGSGDVWIANFSGNSVVEYAMPGSASSAGNSYLASSLSAPGGLAIDSSGNVWVTSAGTSTVTEFSNSGSILSGATGYGAGGLGGCSGFPASFGGGVAGPIAIDGTGNAWISNFCTNSVTKLSNSGAALSGPNGFTAGGISSPGVIAMDASGDAWLANNTTSVVELSPAGASLSGTAGYTAGGIASPDDIAFDAAGDAWIIGAYGGVTKLSASGTSLAGTGGYSVSGLANPSGLAIDGAGNVWIADDSVNLVELSNSGAVLSGSNGYSTNLPAGASSVAIDGSGNAWILDGSSYVTELVGIAVPSVTPLATAVATNRLGSRP